jgi:hypothetical protein
MAAAAAQFLKTEVASPGSILAKSLYSFSLIS